MVFRRCQRLLKDEQAALDATQDVFVQVLRHEDRLHETHPSGLLFRIATHVSLNRLRTRSRGTNPASPNASDDALLLAIAELPAPDDQLSARRLLDRIFLREPDSTRLIAMLHLVDGLTLEETAAEVGLSVSGVRKRLRTLRERLPDLVREEDL